MNVIRFPHRPRPPKPWGQALTAALVALVAVTFTAWALKAAVAVPLGCHDNCINHHERP